MQAEANEAMSPPTAGCPMHRDSPEEGYLERMIAQPFPWPREPFDPPAAYRELREQMPVARVRLADGRPVWLITRYDDVRAVLADPRVSADETRPGFPGMGPRAGVFSKMDDPQHAHLRGLIARNFSIRNVRAMRPGIQQLVDDAIDEMLAEPSRTSDLVPALALRVPATVLGDLLGVPTEERAHFVDKIQAMLDNGDPLDLAAQQRSREIAVEVHEFMEELFGRCLERDQPGEDILGQLVQAHRDGQISRKDAVSTAFLVITAGFDTTANAAALGVLTLLLHPSALSKLRADPTLLDGAIEELLRWLSHVHLVIARSALEDIEVGGVTIPAGEGIMPLNFSANRDNDHYANADTFDIERRARDHLAFGYGVHQCQGQPLARLELNVIFETLLRRVPTLRLGVDPSEIELKMSARIHGVKALPIAW